MRNKGWLKLRLLAATAMGIFLLMESRDSGFLRPVVESRATMVHLFIALFGIAFLIQAFVLAKRLQALHH